jgi:hypothetical protein
MIKTYTDGATIVAILEVDPMPSYTFGPEASKIRYKEPYVSEAQDLKDSGIVPAGIYNGYTPLAVGSNNLSINVDVTRGDSVAVVETRTGKYNLTVRATSNVLLEDFTLVAFPALVVLRTEYSLTTSPLSGMTSSKILVVDPALDDSDPAYLNTGDVRICRVTGIGGGGVVNFTTTPITDRTSTGGPLVTPSQIPSLVSNIAWRYTALPTIDAPSQTYPDTSISFTTTAAQDIVAELQLTGSTIGNGGPYIVFVLDYVSVMVPGTDSNTRYYFGTALDPSSFGGCSKILFPSVPAGSHTIRMKLLGDSGPTNISEYLGIVYYKQ